MEPKPFCQCARPDIHNTWCLSCGSSVLGSDLLADGRDQSPAPFAISDKSKFYEYKPLQGALAIRLLRLHAGHCEEDISFRIYHTNLSHNPDFEALSYTWGPIILSHEGYTPDGIIQMTENCVAALRDLRDPLRDRTLWVDAICINQWSNLEKNHQVPLINRIYAAARRVVIYVGPDTQKMHGSFFDQILGQALELLKPRSIEEDAQARLRELLSRPWFTRVWVLQEIAVAREAILMCGTATLNWKYLSVAYLHNLHLEPVNNTGRVPPALFFGNIDQKPLKDLLTLLNTARSCQSTDPRDKVYALLGLLKESNRQISQDYNKSVDSVFANFTMSIVYSYNHLDILSYAGWQSGDEIKHAEYVANEVRHSLVNSSLSAEALQALPSTTPLVTQSQNWPDQRVVGLISQDLYIHQAFPQFHPEISSNSHCTSWTPIFEHHQVLKSFVSFRYETLQSSQPVARMCVASNHVHQLPALNIRVIEFDIICPYRNFKFSSNDSMRVNFSSPPDLMDLEYWNRDAHSFLSNHERDLLAKFRNYDNSSIHREHDFSTFLDFCIGRRRMCGESCWIICSPQVQPSDRVCAVFGASVPFVLRPMDVDGTQFQLMGECYILWPPPNDPRLHMYTKNAEIDMLERLPWREVCLQ